ncbi:cytochrome c oxidase subunit II [Planococcus lenghuensis]|uniref:Cytochrome aa3 subunit 2 n=1 Tax=Planococcus lenghuensis TaxID=2213202 RepID=A0A1Q2KZD1_9BACL|nr:cytochrome c oxidase subunit II [Planococcus lenghuensis]AQQ53559.1 cytochrome B5 [Planococcus lenghuensis]
MHIHKYEKWWLTFGITCLVVFLTVLGISAFHAGAHPPSAQVYINQEHVDEIAPFDNPGVHKVEGKEWDYEVVVVASAFMFSPMEYEVPLGSKVKFIATTKDVVHGFQIAGTNINMMLEPGYVSEFVTIVDKPGEYLVLCNEYCGVGHTAMASKLKVVDSNAES